MFSLLLQDHQYRIEESDHVSSADSVDLITVGDFSTLATFIQNSDKIKYKQDLLDSLLLIAAMAAEDLLSEIKRFSPQGSKYIDVIIDDFLD